MASCHSDCIVNDTTAFHGSKWLKKVNMALDHKTPLISHAAKMSLMAPMYSLGQNEGQHDFLVMWYYWHQHHDTNGTVKGT